MKTGIPWWKLTMADTVVSTATELRVSPTPPAPDRPQCSDRFCSTPEPPLALKALRAMGAAMSLSFISEHGR